MSSASKMSSASGTQTPQSREHSERTASTDFSPEVLRFKHLSVSSDPFTSAPLSPEARPFEPGPVKRFLPTDSQAFETISDIIRKCPLPDPYVDLRLRMHHGNTFAQMRSGEPLTCFVWASGEQHISSYYAGGEFSWVSRVEQHPVSIKLTRPYRPYGCHPMWQFNHVATDKKYSSTIVMSVMLNTRSTIFACKAIISSTHLASASTCCASQSSSTVELLKTHQSKSDPSTWAGHS